MRVGAEADQEPGAVRSSERRTKPQPWLVLAILGSVVAVVAVGGLFFWTYRDPFRVGTSHHVTVIPIVVCGLEDGPGSDSLPRLSKVELDGRSWFLLSGNLPRGSVIEGEFTIMSDRRASFRAGDVNGEFVREFAPVGCP